MLEKISQWWSPSPQAEYDPTNPKMNPLNPKGLKPCCACPETKSARDECFLRHDPSVAGKECVKVLEEHIACMRSFGFKV